MPVSLALLIKVVLLLTAASHGHSRRGMATVKMVAKTIASMSASTGVRWLTTAELKAMDLTGNKLPIMYFFNWRTCHVCRDLIEDMAYHKAAMTEATSGFLCVNVLDEDNYEYGDEFTPNGNNYIPRIMFAYANGTLRPDIVNDEMEPKQAYYYWTADMVMEKLGQVAHLSGGGGEDL